jgi:hypothetical protein
MMTVLCDNSAVIHINSLSTETVMTTDYYSCLLDVHVRESIRKIKSCLVRKGVTLQKNNFRLRAVEEPTKFLKENDM